MPKIPTTKTPLPVQPSLEQLRKQAKDLSRSASQGDLADQARVAQVLPDLTGKIPLTKAQFVLAREYGFPSWPRLVAYVERISAAPQSQRPFMTDIDYFEGRAQGLLTTVTDGLATSMAQVRYFHPRHQHSTDDEIRAAKLTNADARLILAREHGFKSWQGLKSHLARLQSGATAEPFVTAFEALKASDFAAFKATLEQDSSLVNASGTNGNTLLNLAGSLKQPEAIQLLLESGADPNLGNRFGWTPLHQAAYSNQLDYAQLLIKYGASPNISARGEGGTPLAQALFWGRREMAEMLATHGVFPLNLRVTSGLGRLDLMATFFNADGSLKPEAGRDREFYRPHGGFLQSTITDAPQQILDEALTYAARSNRIEAMEFLVQHGANVNGEPYNGTALGWAIQPDREEAVLWLLDHGADAFQINTFGGERDLTTLHIAAWAGHERLVRLLVARGLDPTARDPRYNGPPAGWAEHAGHHHIVAYLKTLTPGL